MNTAICKTCSATLPGLHKPSMFDREGIGNPGHKMSNPSPPDSEDELDEILFAYQLWCHDGHGRDLRLPGKRMTHDEAKAAIRSWALSQALGAKPKGYDNIGTRRWEQYLKEVFKEPS